MNNVRNANKALKDNGLVNFKIQSATNRQYGKVYTLYMLNGSSKQSLGYAPTIPPLFDQIYMSFNGNPAAQQLVQAAMQQYNLA